MYNIICKAGKFSDSIWSLSGLDRPVESVEKPWDNNRLLKESDHETQEDYGVDLGLSGGGNRYRLI